MGAFVWSDLIAASVLIVGLISGYFKLKARVELSDQAHQSIASQIEHLNKTQSTNFGTLSVVMSEIKLDVAVVKTDQKNLLRRIDKVEDRV